MGAVVTGILGLNRKTRGGKKALGEVLSNFVKIAADFRVRIGITAQPGRLNAQDLGAAITLCGKSNTDDDNPAELTRAIKDARTGAKKGGYAGDKCCGRLPLLMNGVSPCGFAKFRDCFDARSYPQNLLVGGDSDCWLLSEQKIRKRSSQVSPSC